jgi:hypothetical protein
VLANSLVASGGDLGEALGLSDRGVVRPPCPVYVDELAVARYARGLSRPGS